MDRVKNYWGEIAITTGWTIEATLPTSREAVQLGRILPAGTEVFLSMIPTAPVDRQIAAATAIRKAGLEPVPHLAARKFSNEAAITAYLSEIQERASVRRLLLIGGDRNTPAGDFASSLEVLHSSALTSVELDHVYLAGYPEGHPAISDEQLDQALTDKLEHLAALRIAAGVVSQFCFDAGAIQLWLRKLQARHKTLPLKVGLAGPANLLTLTKFAARCGVKASATDLSKNLKMLDRLLKRPSPAALVSQLMPGRVHTDPDANNHPVPNLHFFSFGGIVRTARWARRIMDRQ